MRPARTMLARYAGTCADCAQPIAVGETIAYRRPDAVHIACTMPDGPTTTYRERREARAERLDEWADKRAQKAETAFAKVDSIAAMIPMGQPILVGHHSEGRHRRDLGRIDNGMRAGVESARMADSMRSRADNIRAAADVAIYDDDPDAVERLRAKLAGLEAERGRWNAYNAAVRKAKEVTADALALLDDRQREDLEVCKRHAPWMLGKYGTRRANPNLGGRITQTRQRLARLERAQ